MVEYFETYYIENILSETAEELIPEWLIPYYPMEIFIIVNSVLKILSFCYVYVYFLLFV